MVDFPAAHSMDTYWFAIDADGNIGYFDSSEGGAVPETWSRTFVETRMQYDRSIEYASDLFDIWREIDNCKILELKIPSYLVDELDHVTESQLEQAKSQDWIFQFSSHDVLDEIVNSFPELSKGTIQILRLTGSSPVFLFWQYFVSLRLSFFKKLIKHRKIVKGKSVSMSHHRGNNHLALLGLFPYAQDSGSPLPYQKMDEPKVPLKLEDLPELLQDAISWTWFENIRFSETQSLQPIEHMKCKTWRSTKWWIDLEGNEREGHPHDH